MYVVWQPMSGGEEKHVADAAKLVPDRRATHYWDGPGTTLRTYQQVLELPEVAWDIYLVYGPDARWEGPLPPAPEHWEHQLGSKQSPRVEGQYLDPARFATTVSQRLPAPDSP